MNVQSILFKYLLMLVIMLPGSVIAIEFHGVKIDTAATETIDFTVPDNASDTWIRLVTDATIANSNFSFSVSDGTDTSDSFQVGISGPPLFENGLAQTIATISHNYGPGGHPNVYQIHITHDLQINGEQTWSLNVTNNFSQLVVFAFYAGVTENELDGPNVWIRDNATLDQSGHHTLNNINNLDDMSVPTPSEFWKSPAVRFTTAELNPVDDIRLKNPVSGQLNKVIVNVRNFGTTSLDSAVIEARWTHFTAGLPPLDSPSWDVFDNPPGSMPGPTVGSQIVQSIGPGQSKELTFHWDNPPLPGPGEPNHYCISVKTADSAGALDPVSFGSTNVNTLTSSNTNASHRNVAILEQVVTEENPSTPFFFSAPIRFFITNPFEGQKQAAIRIKGLPVMARASKLKVELKNVDRIRLKGMRFESKAIVRESSPGNAGNAIFRLGTDTPAVTARVSTTTNGNNKPVLSKLRVQNPVELQLSGLQLGGGERRLVELDIGMTETVKVPSTIAVDIESVIDGKVVGGVTNIIELQRPEKQLPPNIWKLIAILIFICLVILLPFVFKKKQAS